MDGETFQLDHGHVVIAAITSCTNTSNPSVMLGAGLLARNAVARGPERAAVGQDVAGAGLEGRDRVPRARRPDRAARASSASTSSATAARRASATPARCRDEISAAVNEARPRGRARCCQRQPQLRGPHQPRREDELPRVAAAGRRLRARRHDGHRPRRATRSGIDADGKPVYLRDIWPSTQEVAADRRGGRAVGHVPLELRRGLRGRRALERRSRSRPATASPGTTSRPTCASRRTSRACRPSPTPLDRHRGRARARQARRQRHDRPHLARRLDQEGRARPGGTCMSTASSRATSTPTASRRGNHEVMMRGTFANIRLRNQLAPGDRGRRDAHWHGRRGDVDLRRRDGLRRRGHAARRARRQGVRLGLVARLGGEGHEPARRPRGDRRVLRAHPPLEPRRHGRAAAAVPRRRERRVARPDRRGGVHDHRPRRADQRRRAAARGARSRPATWSSTARVRIDTPKEAEYFRHGGILQYVLRSLLAE